MTVVEWAVPVEDPLAVMPQEVRLSRSWSPYTVAYPGPVDGSDDPHEQVQGDLEVLGNVVGQQLQRFAHQGVLVTQPRAYLVQGGVGQVNPFGPGQQQGERDRLGVAVGEGGVVGLREQERTPIPSEAQERLRILLGALCDGAALDGELVEHLTAE